MFQQFLTKAGSKSKQKAQLESTFCVNTVQAAKKAGICERSPQLFVWVNQRRAHAARFQAAIPPDQKRSGKVLVMPTARALANWIEMLC